MYWSRVDVGHTLQWLNNQIMSLTNYAEQIGLYSEICLMAEKVLKRVESMSLLAKLITT